MRTSLRVLTVATGVALAAVPAVALASGGHGPETLSESLKPMGFHALNLAVLLALLAYFVGGSIKTALAARSEGIARDIDGAGAAEAEAKARFDELSTKLDGFETELAQMRSDAEHQAEFQRTQLMERARREVAAIEASAEASIRAEQSKATDALRAEAAKLAVGLAARRVSDNIGEEDHQRLDRQFLSALGVQEVGHG